MANQTQSEQYAFNAFAIYPSIVQLTLNSLNWPIFMIKINS